MLYNFSVSIIKRDAFCYLKLTIHVLRNINIYYTDYYTSFGK